ncbi:Hypothetical_protein [Hexamita inflata]|uniref:Hypothetical_protein n=1 Tax=Hexamita inflata TaxID=28002 RepID=A0AA86NHP5_9EUKA|nr:Hypothetical protein HINF_LOCUS7297 [Hexamita inflata]
MTDTQQKLAERQREIKNMIDSQIQKLKQNNQFTQKQNVTEPKVEKQVVKQTKVKVEKTQKTEQKAKISKKDKEYILQYVQEHSGLTVGKIAGYLLKSDFKGRNIDPTQLKELIDFYRYSDITTNPEETPAEPENSQQIVGQNQVQENDKTILIFNTFTEIYKEGLKKISKVDCSQKTPNELCELIQQLHLEVKKVFWRFVQSQYQPHSSIYYLKTYHKHTYQQIMNNNAQENNIEADEQTIIAQVAQVLAQETANTQSQLTTQDKPNTQTFYLKAQELQNTYTAFYKRALRIILNQDFSDKQPRDIYQQIVDLDSIKSKQFWQILEQIVEPKKSIPNLKKYFENSYFRVKYTELLNQNDRLAILNTIKQNTHLTEHSVLQLLIKQFKNRDICTKDIQRYLSKNYTETDE